MQFLKQFAEKTKKWKVAVTVMAAIVVFITTYALILPAITLDEDTAEKQGGIELQDNAAPSDENMDAAADSEPAAEEESTDADKPEGDKVQAASISDGGKTYNIEVAYDENAGIPEDAELKVEEINDDSDEYADYIARTEELVGKGRTVDFARFFDIRIMVGDMEIQPSGDVDVRIEMADKLKKKDVTAIHFGTPENDKKEVEDTVLDAEVEKAETKKMESAVSFGTDGFSVYGVVSTTIEKEVLTSDGQKYKITVTCGEDAGVPEGADLDVSEITADSGDDSSEYETLVSRAEEALGWDGGSASYIRLFDIKIVDEDGEKVTIQAPVDVKIELADKDDSEKAAKRTHVVHFADGSKEGDVVEDVSVDGNTISFSADGFSAYAIVDGPDPAETGWYSVGSMEEFIEKATQGLYIGHVDGYYFMNTLKTDSKRSGIYKTKPAQNYPPTAGSPAAALYYFEQVPGTADQFYAYCYDRNGNKQYVYNGNNNSLSFTTEENATAFTFSMDDSGVINVKNGQWYWNMQGSASGERFCCYNSPGDPNNNLRCWYRVEPETDPYELNGKTYGLMNWNGGAAGKAVMAKEIEGANSLEAKALTVMAKLDNNEDRLFVPNDSDISMWTFTWVDNDNYYLTTIADGSTKYLKIDSNGLSLVSEPTTVQVIPGSGVHAGEVSLKGANATLTYSGDISTGFKTGGAAGTEWLHFVEESELTTDYFMTYSAEKVSVSDTERVGDGAKIIVYTRVWNETTKRYDFFAIDHDGTLVPCYETGDSIEWVGNRINTLLWDFTEYRDETTGEPSYYYELYNEYSQKYIAPQVTGGQILADDPIGINLNGRRAGKYYTTILAWDDPNYTYAGYKVQDGRIVSCPKAEAMDFYFAIMEDVPVDDTLHTVPTVDHKQYGITMKIKDFDSRKQMSDFLGNNEGGATTETVDNLLSTNLGNDGYPETNPEKYPDAHPGSLGQLFEGSYEVNHLFIENTYKASGYYEFDSTQNFANLFDPNTGRPSTDFTVYKELGSYDSAGERDTLKHGQFFPFNKIEPGVYASVNSKNLFTATAQPLPDGDPRKNENLYLIKNVDCFYGVELEASFIQTPSGLDAWGHDIIYEFTGDDDFWLYVDGELVIDLGGIHSAIPGSVNFRTGEVNVNGKHTTLRDLFYENYIGRGHTEAEAQAYVDGLFVQNSDGQWVFKDNTTHTMRIFYMERGAGAANLHMRFNLASIKPGTVLLSKELSGVDSTESILAEFAYQIKYRDNGVEKYLTNATAGSTDPDDHVFYKDTVTPVKYRDSLTIKGTTYNNVFMLKPGEVAEIDFTSLGIEDAKDIQYEIIECGVNKKVYDEVYINGEQAHGTHETAHTWDYGTGYKKTSERASVAYTNHVKPQALRTLTFDKILYAENGTTRIHYPENQTKFSFRLSFGTEFDDDLTLANMHTYHVKDPDGYYCRWDAATQNFASLGKRNYEDLSPEEKQSATFTTSMNGSISNIPVDHTVEVREVLTDTQFGVVERPKEVPDGYSFQKYVYDHREYTDAEAGVTDVIDNHDPHVDVCNLKGWGLRVNKVWTDQDYMEERDATYFAVYTKVGDDLRLVNGTVRRMDYEDNPQTEYWYFEHLPVTSASFSQYEIREVVLTGDSITVDSNGTVIGYNTITPIEDGEEMTLNGKQKGETTTSPFTYKVLYEKGELPANANVRVDTVTNDRPGIILNKTEWDGESPLSGATFTLKKGDDLIGTFTSDENGRITVAFLSDNVEYTLTETKTPQGYHGLETPMTIELQRTGQSGTATVVVSGADTKYYKLTQAHGATSAMLTIKDRPYTFQTVKKDADTEQPMQGVKFELHKQVTVGDVTDFDPNPMPGYEELVTDEDGVIPKLDNTLPAGVYQLREKETPSGYETLSPHTEFTVSATGDVTLGKHPEGVVLVRTDDDEGAGQVTYSMTVPNSQKKQLRFKKVDIADLEHSALEGAVFDMYRVDEEGHPLETLYTDLTSDREGFLEHNTEPGYTDQTIFKLGVGIYHLVETKAPDGYNLREDPVVVTISNNNGTFVVTFNDGTISGNVEPDEDNVYTVKMSNSSGVELPSTGGPGTAAFYILGAVLMILAGGGLVLTRRRRRAADDEL